MKKGKMKKSLHFIFPIVNEKEIIMRFVMPQYLVTTNMMGGGASHPHFIIHVINQKNLVFFLLQMKKTVSMMPFAYFFPLQKNTSPLGCTHDNM